MGWGGVGEGQLRGACVAGVAALSVCACVCICVRTALQWQPLRRFLQDLSGHGGAADSEGGGPGRRGCAVAWRAVPQGYHVGCGGLTHVGLT